MGMGALFGGGGSVTENKTESSSGVKYEGEYEVLDEDGFRMLSHALGGG